MFFSKPNEIEACGMYSYGHLILFTITFILICIALFLSRKMNKEQVKKTIKYATIIVWILEIIKIIFNIVIGNISNPNTYIPLYFCSLILYAGILSGFCSGTLKRVGDVFLSTGGIVAGICFLIYPSTSITIYPIFHYISIQSFVLHGIMIYIGILMNITDYIEIKLSDIKYYFTLILLISIIAYIFNLIFDSNLMFISKNFPGTIIEIIYNNTGIFFSIIMIIIQATLPFLFMYFLRKVCKCIIINNLNNKYIDSY